MTTIEQLTIDKMRNLPSELQQQLEDEGLLKAMQETKDDQTIELANAKLYLDSLP